LERYYPTGPTQHWYGTGLPSIGLFQCYYRLLIIEW